MAAVIDPIVDGMQQHKTMDIATISCLIGRLMKHLRDDTFPNVVSIAEVIYTKSGDVDIKELYDKYVNSKATTTFFTCK